MQPKDSERRSRKNFRGRADPLAVDGFSRECASRKILRGPHYLFRRIQPRKLPASIRGFRARGRKLARGQSSPSFAPAFGPGCRGSIFKFRVKPSRVRPVRDNRHRVSNISGAEASQAPARIATPRIFSTRSSYCSYHKIRYCDSARAIN